MLSLLIPTYNYNVEPLVLELQKQAEALGIAYEIIVFDDASNEKQNIISDFNQFIHFENNDTNLGRTQTRLKLALKAKFDNLLFLDADVLPEQNNFLATYLPFFASTYSVVCGGCSYEERSNNAAQILRWKYGKEREEKKASVRNKNPYSSVFSGNILIKKELFLKYNFNETANWYGMDIYFAYQLFANNVPVKHLDNAVIHLGLESNEVFLKKSLESVVSRHTFLADQPNIEKINSLLKHYKTLKKMGIAKLFGKTFFLFKPALERNILSKNPNLLYFDIYRLGYLCNLENN